ncbi:MAG: bestrophin family ion channel [Bacteroidota bacterium]
MVTYNPKDWLLLLVHFHKSDTFRVLLPALFLLGFITAAVTFAEQTFFKGYMPDNLTIFHQLSGFIISLVLVFRVNSAYDRWWEGRKLWGSLLNNSRNLAVKLNTLVPKDDKVLRKELQTLITNFAFALKEHLRDNPTIKGIEFTNELKEEHYATRSHKPNYIATQLTALIMNYSKKSTHISNEYLILNENINSLTDICGSCERIKNTPIPYSYSIFIKRVVFIYIITMPLSFGISIGYWSIPIVMFMFYAFASLELISEEIEEPFGSDDNDLPTDEIAEKIKKNTTEILLPWVN